MYTNILFVLPNANLPTGSLPFQPIVSEVLFFQCHTETLNLPLGDAGTISLHAHPPPSLPMLRTTHHQSLPMMLCMPVHPNGCARKFSLQLHPLRTFTLTSTTPSLHDSAHWFANDSANFQVSVCMGRVHYSNCATMRANSANLPVSSNHPHFPFTSNSFLIIKPAPWRMKRRQQSRRTSWRPHHWKISLGITTICPFTM